MEKIGRLVQVPSCLANSLGPFFSFSLSLLAQNPNGCRVINVYNALEFPSAKTISPSLLTSDFWAVSQSSYVNRYSARFESLQNNSHVIESAMPGHIRAQRQLNAI